jgi:hypothetical protein
MNKVWDKVRVNFGFTILDIKLVNISDDVTDYVWDNIFLNVNEDINLNNIR